MARVTKRYRPTRYKLSLNGVAWRGVARHAWQGSALWAGRGVTRLDIIAAGARGRGILDCSTRFRTSSALARCHAGQRVTHGEARQAHARTPARMHARTHRTHARTGRGQVRAVSHSIPLRPCLGHTSPCHRHGASKELASSKTRVVQRVRARCMRCNRPPWRALRVRVPLRL